MNSLAEPAAAVRVPDLGGSSIVETLTWDALKGYRRVDGELVRTFMEIRSYDEYDGFSACYERRLDLAPNIFHDMTPSASPAGKFKHKFTLFYGATRLTGLLNYWPRGDAGYKFATRDHVLLVNDTAWLAPDLLVPGLSEDKRFGLVTSGSPGHRSVVEPKVIFIGSRANYYHFVVDFLPYLILAGQVPELADLPFLFQVKSPHQAEFLEILGIARERELVLSAPVDHALVADFDEVVLPSPLPLPVRLEVVRKALTKPDMPPGTRRLFIGRRQAAGAARRLENEDDVAARLATHGFETVYLEDLSVRGQIALFGEAACVVAAHGAALANMVFAPRDCAIVELMNDLCAHHDRGIFNCYRRLAHCLQLDYHRLSFAALGEARAGFRVQETPFVCDLGRLEGLLQALDAAA